MQDHQPGEIQRREYEFEDAVYRSMHTNGAPETCKSIVCVAGL